MSAAGVFFYSTKTNRYLYLLRSKKPSTWAMPGGKIERDETLLDCIKRECEEEIGFFPKSKPIPIQKFTNHSFVYHTFFCQVEDEFIPILNSEHIGYAWVAAGQYPNPLHPGLFNTVNFELVIKKLEVLTKNGPKAVFPE